MSYFGRGARIEAKLDRIPHVLERLKTMPTTDDLNNAIADLEGDLAPITAELGDLAAQLADALKAGVSVPADAVARLQVLHGKFLALETPAPAAPVAPPSTPTSTPTT